jgi:DNA-binding NtrC family response regulator
LNHIQSTDGTESASSRGGERTRAALARVGQRENISKRLLLVDDEASIRATLPLILQQRGFHVNVAASVPEAIQKIQNHNFDAVLSDLNIGQPGDGFTVVRALRKVNPRCVAIILTGYPGFESAVEAFRRKSTTT